jgi:peptidyl-prolyl cis-trans isomerase C
MKTPNISSLLMVAATLCIAALPVSGYAADAVAKVNGKEIPQSRMDLLLKSATAQGQADTPELRNRVKDELVTREVLLQEAAKIGIDKNPEVVLQIDVQRQTMVINAFLQEYVKTHPISEETMRKEYEAAKAQAPSKEYRAHHILVKDEAEAKKIIAQIKGGGNFEKIAAQKSEDQGSKVKGGDLDWAPAGRYVPPFSDALTKLKKGQMTDTPVKSDYGWHVIRLDDERSTKIPPFEEVKNNIQQQMQQQMVQKAIADLRAKAKIE